MMEIHLQFEDPDGMLIWSDTVTSQVTFVVGEVIRLVKTVELGCDELWTDESRLRGDFQVERIEQSFEQRYGSTVASVRSLHFITVVVRPA
jgi:hypothetical protein